MFGPLRIRILPSLGVLRSCITNHAEILHNHPRFPFGFIPNIIIWVQWKHGNHDYDELIIPSFNGLLVPAAGTTRRRVQPGPPGHRRISRRLDDGGWFHIHWDGCSEPHVLALRNTNPKNPLERLLYRNVVWRCVFLTGAPSNDLVMEGAMLHSLQFRGPSRDIKFPCIARLFDTRIPILFSRWPTFCLDKSRLVSKYRNIWNITQKNETLIRINPSRSSRRLTASLFIAYLPCTASGELDYAYLSTSHKAAGDILS